MSAAATDPPRPRPRRKRIAYTLRDAPTGILLMAAVFAMIGLTSIVGGGWLVVFGASGSLWAGAVAAIAGPAILYLCYNLVRLKRWTWLTVAVLVGLMLGSSVIRIIAMSSLDGSVIAEIVVELALGYYLLRPSIRSEFGW